MYRKVRLQLTLLFLLVTLVLLAVLLGISFFLSAKSQLSIRLSSFTNQAFTVAEAVREQNVLTYDWLNARESTADFRIYLWDNGVPLFHNSHPKHVSNPSYESYLPETSAGYLLRPAAGSSNISIGCHGLLPQVLIYHRQMVKNNSLLQLYFLQPLDSLYAYLGQSFLLYLLLFAVSVILLGLFCWYFTGRLLAPLLSSQEGQNRFISAASHELRTPLAVILANASACEKAPPAQQKPFFQVIAREGRQMSNMLEQLLTLSKADGHGLRLQIEKTDLQTLLLEIYENFLPLAARSGHHLEIRLPEAEFPLCECDPFRIRQVLHILLHNGLSYTPPESNLILFIAEGSYDKEISIGVQDDGEGIPEDEQDKIFDRFYRRKNHSDSNPSKGINEQEQKWHHGLGLAVAKEIAAAHKGTLSVSSAPGGGALFLLTLPVISDSKIVTCFDSGA